ncbi:MAG: hypothetical protein CL424_12220 [Acidimicrobiaceae bacterium]|nr:hypothetical protein [Acidimicrobiaceae bacterium]
MNDLDELERELGPTLRSTFDTCIAEPAGRTDSPAEQPRDDRDPVVGSVETVRASPGRRRLVGALAVAAVAIGVVSVAAVASRDGRSSPPSAPATISSTDQGPLGTGPADTIPGTDAATTVGPDVVAEDLGIALPTFVPEGYVLDDVQLTRNWRPVAQRVIPDRTQYVQRIDGTIAATATLSSQPLDAEFDTDKGSITVHGSPAQIFDNGEGIHVVWAEADRIVTFASNGVGWDETAALAERTIVDAESGSVTLPSDSGFEIADLPSAPAADAAALSVSYRSGSDQDGRIEISRWPNSGQDTLEVIEFRMTRQNWDVETATVNEHPALVLSPPTTESPPLRQVQWIDQDGTWAVVGRLPAGTLTQVASGLESATLEQARRLRNELDADLASLPELDRTTLDNGIEISIHTIGNGVGAYCVHLPEQFCQRVVGESSIIGEPHDSFTRTTWIDDQPWMVGWADGRHQPTLYTEGGSTDPVADAVDGALVEADADGTFIAVPSPAEDFQFSFDPDTFPVFGATVTGDPESDLLR